jgi:hypothetical protein
MRADLAGVLVLLAAAVVMFAMKRPRMDVVAPFIIVGMERAISFSVPLSIQIVQGGPTFQTSIATMPFMLTVFFTAILIVRLYKRCLALLTIVPCLRLPDYRPGQLPADQGAPKSTTGDNQNH